ncbi:hypothetical protein C0993_004478 [Termitomyces sp. T159_Od127]|nr:hypothetical protein C0993_004478 [Termitomyces sp. T159_Od127]
MDGTNYATDQPHSQHFLDSLNSSMDEESKSAESRDDFCIRRVLQVYPDVDRNQLHSFIKNNTHDYLHSTIDHALWTVRSGSHGLEVTSLGSSSGKRRYNAHEGQGSVKEPLKRVKVDYANRARPRTRGLDYVELAVSQLHKDFSYVEEGLIRAVFKSLGSCYAPTHLFLLTKQKEVLKRLHLTTVPPVPNFAKSDKGKRRALEDAEFDRERRWLLEVLSNQGNNAHDVVEGGISRNQLEIASDDRRMMEYRHNNDVGLCSFALEFRKIDSFQVIQAAATALEQIKRDYPDVEQNEFIQDLPPLRRKPAPRRPRRRTQGLRLRHPVLTNNQPDPDILQHAAPLLALAPQPIPPVDLMYDQPFVPQVGPIIEPPRPLGNIPLPMLQHQQIVPTQADYVYQQLKINMMPVLPQLAVAPKPSPVLHHFPPVPALPPPLLSPSHSETPLHHLLHAPNYLNRPPISPTDTLGLYGPLMSTPPAQEANYIRRVNLLHPDAMIYPEQVPRQTVDGILPLYLPHNPH